MAGRMQEHHRAAVAALPADLTRLSYAELPRYAALDIPAQPFSRAWEALHATPWTPDLRAKADAVLAEADTRPERAAYTGRSFVTAVAA